MDVEKTIEFLIESQAATDARLAALGVKVDKLAESVATLVTIVGSQQERFSVHRERLDAHERRMQANEEEFRAFLKRFDAFLKGRSGNGHGGRRRSSTRGA